MANKYIAVTIGPIFDTVNLASSPSALWAASYLFSMLSKNICQTLTDNGVAKDDIISPFFDPGDELLNKNDGVGLFHDRIIFSADHFSIEDFNDKIKDEAISWAVGIVGPERIDEINILQATYEAMRIAIGQLSPTPQILLNDAVEIPRVSIPQCPIIKGDAKSISIAAASIMAKVTRDRIMMEYDNLYPAYGFASHKGYGSAAHIEAIRTNGPSPIHRNTFIKNFI